MRKVTLDIETTSPALGMGFDPTTMELTVISVHDSETDEFACFTVPELPNLWPILEKADILIGYNSNHFDIPILDRYYPGDLSAIYSIDLLSEIKNSLGRRLKLNSVAEATLGRKKIGSGLDAITWWKNGEYEKVKKYCIEDVRITKEVYDFARKNNRLHYMDLGVKRDILLDTSRWELPEIKGALTYTLPF